MFERGLDIKESLNLGDFGPKIKKLKWHLKEIIEGNLTIWGTNGFRATRSEVTEWKSILGKDESNIHRLVVLIQTSNMNSCKRHIQNLKYQVKILLIKEDLKFTALNSFFTEKYFRRFGFSKNKGNIIIEIIYSKINKK